MRVSSLSLGVIAYSDPGLSSSQSRLHFAVDDAGAFHRYVSAAWSGEPGLHLCLTDGKASRYGLEQAIKKLAATAPLDLFLLYLSGHGEVFGQDGWFCLADAQSGKPSLTSFEIDRLLSTIDASQVLVIADYCYAEASLASSRFFSALEGRYFARSYIASARSDQKAWEDTQLKRSIFSDVFLKSLASGSLLSGPDGMVDLESKLIQHLREQVPLEAAARKSGAIQEPISGGLTARPIKLPTVSARDMRRNLSVSDTLRMRLRQILTVMTVTVIATWIITDLLVYHLAIGSNGAVLVRPGLGAMYNLAPFHLRSEVDTGYSVPDLSPRDQVNFQRLSRGDIFGFTTRTDSNGLSLWLAQLEPALLALKATRARMLARADTPKMESNNAPPIVETAFIAFATGANRRVISDRVYDALSPVDVDCRKNVHRQFDYTLLDLPSDAFFRDLAWRALRINGPQHYNELIELVTAVTYRVDHAKDAEQLNLNMEALAVAARLLELRSPPQLPALAGWCEGAPASLLRALVGDDKTRAESENMLVAGLPATPSSADKDPTRSEIAALAALTALVSRAPLQNGTVERIVASFERSGERVGLRTPLNYLLAETATHQALPRIFRARLFELLNGKEGSTDDEALNAFGLLARNASHLTETELQAIRAWVDRHGEANRTSSVLHEGLGYLALVLPLRPEEREWIVARLSPYSWLPPQTLSYRGEIVISAPDGPAAVALARIHRRQPLEPQLFDRVLTIAAHRHDLQDRSAMLRNLGLTHEPLDKKIVERLKSQKNSAVMRRLHIDMAIAQLSTLQANERARLLSQLYEVWRKSRAPELRIALAEIIGSVSAEGNR